jgi:hypothetical protein
MDAAVVAPGRRCVVTAPDMSILVERVRAEIVGRGFVPTPVIDASARDAVLTCWAQGAAGTYIVQRFTHVLRRFSEWESGDKVHDAQIALGEYDLYLQLQAGASGAVA